MNCCDLHRHLGGSISIGLIAELLNTDVKSVTNFIGSVPNTYDDFFKRFDLLNKVEWTLMKVEKCIEDVIWSIKRDNLNYCEIKFSINKFIPYIDMNVNELISWMIYKFDEYSSKWGVNVDAILSLKHDMDKRSQLEVSSCIFNNLVAESIAGIDIVGNERYFDVDFYKPIFNNWNSANKICMAHVGEIDNIKNVKDAINILKVDRICHGIAAANDVELAKISRDKMIAFDVCLSSNVCTGVATIKNHPVLKMLENGFIITIGTDDPVILNTNIKKEYELLQEITGLSNDDILKIKNSVYDFSAFKVIERKVNKNNV